MKIILTGANGQVGREVVDLMLGRTEIPFFPFTKAELDITDFHQVEKIIHTHRPQMIINAAAYTAVDKAEQEKEKAFRVNRDGVENLALLCKRYDTPLIHLSTDYVFDGNKASPYVEEDTLSPLNIYGASKAEGEMILQEVWKKHIILRVSWVFGQYGHNFIKTILRLAQQERELKIVSDQKGCPTAASDIAKTLIRLAEQLIQGQPHWGIFHYCGDKPTTWFELAKHVVKYGKDFFSFKVENIYPIRTNEFPAAAKRPKNSEMSVKKIKEEYGINPSDWESALRKMVTGCSSSPASPLPQKTLEGGLLAGE